MKPEASPRRGDVDRLILRLQTGVEREETFRLLFRRYYRLVYRFFSDKGLEPDECENLTQETFLAVFRGVPSFRRESSFDVWLFAIARKSLARMWRRVGSKSRRAVEVAIDDPATDLPRLAVDEDDGPDQLAFRGELDQILTDALAELPDQMRRCATLRLRHGLKYREIADALGISVDAVKVQLNRARKRLREHLGDYLESAAL